MSTGWSFDLSQFDQVWKAMLQVAILLIFLLIGNTLRRVIPFLRKAFIPSALIGGLLLFIINISYEGIVGLVQGDNAKAFLQTYSLVDRRIMQIITYHGLAIGFIASSLKIVAKEKKTPIFESVQNGAITGGTYMLQAVFGIGVSLIFFWATRNFFYDAGVLLPLGFGQGPGNALTWDINFTEMTKDWASNKFDGQGSVGLTIASIGFLVASIVGVIYMNIYRHKGEIVHKDIKLQRSVSDFELNDEIEDSESVDKMSIQVAFVGVGFALSFLVMFFFAKLTDWTGVALFNSVAWGFNFIWGVLAANLIKLVVKFLRKKNLMHRRYINNYQMDRISGFAFDLMIVAGVAAIDVEAVGPYLPFILVLSAVGTVITIIYVRMMTKMCFKNYQHEAFLVNFGTLTGTASNGMIFLREIDPNNETPMSNIFIISQLPAMIFVAPLLLLLNMSATSEVKCYIVFAIFFVLFALYTTFLILSSKGLIFKKKQTE